MLIKRKNVQKTLFIFLLLHLTIWTLVPSFSNINLPLDTIEALAWGSNLDWGFNKHPPMSAFLVEIFYKIFGSQDWAYYLLSQICLIISFVVIFKFAEEFFKNKIFCLLSVLLLEGVYFYNFTTPEFNVNVCQLPFWALSVLFCWRGIKYNKIFDWLLFGSFTALGVLPKYLFIYVGIAFDVFILYLIIRRKIDFKCLVSFIPFFIILFPHLIWLNENDYISITYALHRTGVVEENISDHFVYPIIFLGKQIGILLPFFAILLLAVSKIKIKFNFKDNKLLFLLAMNIIPIVLMFLTSMIMGVKIRTMWMTPFYLFIGVLFIYIFQSKIKLNKLKYSISLFIILFFLSPAVYLYVSISQNDKRTDYPGKEISMKVQNKYSKNFKSEIKLVIGEEWHGGNLSYHLKSRPKWLYVLNDENINKMNLSSIGSVTTIGVTEQKITKKFSSLCEATKGKFYIIEEIGFCMNGIKK